MKIKKHRKTLKIPKIILLTGKFLALISPKLAALYAARLFTTPRKHKIPKREHEMDAQSVQHLVTVPGLDKQIVVYELGSSPKKVLLVHGWSGRGTQLVKFAEGLVARGYSTVSFDAPAHGKSPGKTTLMPEFIASILYLEQQYGPFQAAIGHSLGGMSLLNAMRKGLKLDQLIIIGSGDVVKDITDDFVSKLQLPPKISDLMRQHFERESGESMDSFSAYLSAETVTIPVLVIHDDDDDEVPVRCGIHINKHLINGNLLLTSRLGHRKILGDRDVIDRTLDFIQYPPR